MLVLNSHASTHPLVQDPIYPPLPMAPPPRPLLFLLLTTILALTAAEQPLCSPQNLKSHPCPPFSSSFPPPFPFSVSPGCGHPSFQLHCSSPHSFISINNLSFSLLQYQPSSSSLLLTPRPTTTHCSAVAAIPPQPINLTGTPFRVSDAWCSRLSLLKPCPNSLLPNCSLCPHHCSLIKNPANLFLNGCGSNPPPVSDHTCQSDVIDFLHRSLALGIEIDWEQDQDPYFSHCSDCRSRSGICGFNSSDPDKTFVCVIGRVELSPPWIHHKVALLSTVFALLCMLCFLVTAFVHLWNRRLSGSLNPEDPTALFLNHHRTAGLLPPVFTFDELESSTNRFDPKRLIGDGGFGSVYLGQLLDNRFVAVKQLHHFHHKAVSTKSFCNEILILSSIDHPNLVKLHGYCSDPRGLLLVYDYIPNGTLADHLHGPMSLYKTGALTWQVRVDIALQIAMAIEYLHFSVHPPIVHRDITTSNIFVEKDMRVKLGDFGLSRLLALPEKTEHDEEPGISNNTNSSSTGFVWTGPQGTPGYLDPDYHHSFLLTEKSDVYSYGVVLMELVSGMKAVDRRREKREVALAEMVVSRIQMGLLHQVVDPVLAAVDGGHVVKESVGAVAELAFRCVAVDKDDRPDLREVTAELRRIWSRTRGVKGSNSSVVVVPES